MAPIRAVLWAKSWRWSKGRLPLPARERDGRSYLDAFYDQGRNTSPTARKQSPDGGEQVVFEAFAEEYPSSSYTRKRPEVAHIRPIDFIRSALAECSIKIADCIVQLKRTILARQTAGGDVDRAKLQPRPHPWLGKQVE